MKDATLDLLSCPMCHQLLHVVHRRTVDEAGRLRDGLLACRICTRRYPVMEWIPRLVPPEQLSEAERLGVDAMGLGPDLETVADPAADPTWRIQEIERRARAKLLPAGLSARRLRRAEEQFVRALEPSLEEADFFRAALSRLAPGAGFIADLGDGQGRSVTGAPAVLFESDSAWAELARLRDPGTAVVRADPLRLPLADGAADFIAGLWTSDLPANEKAFIRELARVSRAGVFAGHSPRLLAGRRMMRGLKNLGCSVANEVGEFPLRPARRIRGLSTLRGGGMVCLSYRRTDKPAPAGMESPRSSA